jgi:phosphohistidine phosphatase
MELYFLRHGKAVDAPGPDAPDDFSRPLTDKGIEEMEAEAKALQALGIEPDVILTSPLVRAKQTAEIVARRLGLKKRLIETDALAPGCELNRLAKLLDEHRSANSLLLVGHEPDFSTLVAELIGTKPSAVELKKGGLALVELKPPVRRGGGVLHWLVAPKLLLRSD